MHRDVDEVEPLGWKDEWAPCELDGRLQVGRSEFLMLDAEVPMSSIPASRVDAEREARQASTVDRIAHRQDDIVIGRYEVEVGREPACVAEPTLAQTGSSFEHQTVTVEEALLAEQPEQVILRHVEQSRSIGVGTTGTVAADEGPCQLRRHCHAFPA